MNSVEWLENEIRISSIIYNNFLKDITTTDKPAERLWYWNQQQINACVEMEVYGELANLIEGVGLEVAVHSNREALSAERFGIHGIVQEIIIAHRLKARSAFDKALNTFDDWMILERQKTRHVDKRSK